MKTSTLILIALASPVFAGTNAKDVLYENPPAPANSSLWSWFTGGSTGYLVDFEEAMHHVHFGVNTPWNLGQWNLALFAELGYTETDESMFFPRQFREDDDLTLSEELRVMPLTINVKLQREIAPKWSAYIGAGVGVAFVQYKFKQSADGDNPASSYRADDEVFAAQVFAGIAYNATTNLQIYGGARWLYVDYDVPVGDSSVGFDDDLLIELGIRYKF